MSYLANLLVMIEIYVILAASLNLMVGYSGLVSLCHAAFFGIGAYLTALLSTRLGWPWLPSMLVAAPLTGLMSQIVAVPSLRLKSDYFLLGTLGFQAIVIAVMGNWERLTGGYLGISSIPGPAFGRFSVEGTIAFAVFCTFATGLCLAAVRILLRSPFGRMLQAVRDDDVAAGALGKNVPAARMTVFFLAATIAAFAGSLFAGYTHYIDPPTFSLMEAILMVSMVLIGGAGSFWGPVVGAALLVLLPEGLRFIHFPDAQAANVRQIIYGLLIIVLMRVRPQGLLGQYAFRR